MSSFFEHISSFGTERQEPENDTDAGFFGATGRFVIGAFIVALSVGLAAHLLHVGNHAGHEAGLGAGIYHWLRDSLLAVPVALLVIFLADEIIRRWSPSRRIFARLCWALMVGLGYAVALVPGGMAHGRLFPAEGHSGDAFIHALSDAVALLPASVYAALAVAFLWGMQLDSVSPVVAAFRSVRSIEWTPVQFKPARHAMARAAVALATFATILPAQSLAIAQTAGPDPVAAIDDGCNRVITADVVALDQPFYYNRLGAINANGMIYALARDVVVSATGQPLSALTNAERAAFAGQVSLRADKRPRPLTLRANEGDCLQINFTNLLDPDGFVFDLPADFPTGQIIGLGDPAGINPQVDDQPLTREASIHIDGLELQGDIGSDGSNVGQNNTPGSLVAPGGSTSYTYLAPDKGTHLLYSMGTTLGAEGGGGTRSYGLFGAVNVEPGPTGDFPGSDWYRSQLTRQEMDWATPAEEFTDWNENGTWDLAIAEPFIDDWNDNGTFEANYPEPFEDTIVVNGTWDEGEAFTDLDGDGVWDASLTDRFTDWNSNGVWDSAIAEPLLDTNGDGIWNEHRTTPGGQPILDYAAVYPAEAGPGKVGLPIVAILDGNEIVHSDINAIIDDRGYPYQSNDAYPTRGTEPFREFTVIFHDESFGVQAFPGFYNDPVLKHTLHGVQDSFPINYGSGGIGSEIIANRLGVGPMWDCSDCKYEEFFLTSFTVGDPAMIVDIPANTTDTAGNIIPGSKATKALYPDDPSNVHHSYLGDRVVYRNLHAGPKEHHIFHLHAHQWQSNPDDAQSNYLDGQALGPGSGYSYEIAYGGSGNRNLTVGDSIFHCHFYPHFAQGMWELWRTHDVFEQGTLMGADGKPAAGSRALPDGEIVAGTPIPGVVPMPGMAMAPMPDAAATIVASDLNGDTIADSSQFDANGDGTADIFQAIGEFGESVEGSNNVDSDGDGSPDIFVDLQNPGYPWFTPGLVGHRPPTPALDLLDDGGLPRHVVTSGPDEDNLAHAGAPVEMYVSRLDFNKVLHEASAIQLPEGGTAVEQIAMAFHAGDADGVDGGAFYETYLPDDPRLGEAPPATPAFEVNGLPPQPGAPFADPCRAFDGSGPWIDDYADGTATFRTIKGANIEMPVTLNKVGWHFQQQRFEALWEDVVPTLNEERAPQPMVMRLNSTDCAEFHHTNLVPNVYQLDDFQVRTPTDIIGQHIHLVKFDVMSADGSANGWNYEDGTLSPDEVRERIEAFNNGGGFTQLDGSVTTELEPEAHPFFGADSPIPGQNWLGARTTIQRWYADPLLERAWDGGVGTVFTHDHYGPSTHQQVGLYSTLLIEPEDSVWLHNETGEQLGVRNLGTDQMDGGASGWQAIIVDCDAAKGLPGVVLPDPSCSGAADFEAHREFYFEFADFQHAYEAGGGALGTQLNENLLGPSALIPTYADFDDAINPSFRLRPPDPADIFFHPNACPGPLVGQVNLARPCPEAISADDPGTYALNFRNEPIGLRVFNDQLGAGAGQTPGLAGDLAFAYQSRTDRATPELNSQPVGPYPPLTADIQPGDPWTPILRVYMGDQVRIRVQVGAHEEEHNFTIPGLKWRKEPNSPNSGWKNSEFFGIDEYFNLDVPIVPDTSSGTPARVDYIYTVGAELEGMWNGVWGILRSYGKERSDLVEVPAHDVGRNGYVITNETDDNPLNDFDGICPIVAPDRPFAVTAVRAVDVLGPQGIIYNDRGDPVMAPAGGVNGVGPLTDPTALMYVLTEDLVFDDVGNPIGLKPGTPVEPLILRAAAGDCVRVQLSNALPADLSATEMPGFNALPPIIHKDENVDGAGGITSFNANDLTPSSYVGLTPQLLAFDPRSNGGFSTGLTTGRLVAPGETGTYQWYAGDIRVTSPDRRVQGNRTQFTLEHTPVEFGAVGLMPADRIKGSESGFVGAMVIEPQGSTWVEDPGTRAQATVTKSDGITAFRDFVTIMQNDLNLRYGGTVQAVNPDGTLGATFDCAADPSPMECAVPSIAAEGPFGPPEDPQDTGQKAINYGADPLWFRLGITPDTPFGSIHRNPLLEELIPDVFANSLIGDQDPQVPVYRASPTGPDEARFRVLMPGGHARGTTWTLHGHQWQRQPYVCGPAGTKCDLTNGSSGFGDNPISEYLGVQEGINPTGHWDFVVNLGGRFNVTGDYLLRDQASFGSYQGLWGILRYDNTAPVAVDVSVTVPKYGQVTTPVLGADLDGDDTSVSVVAGPAYGTATVNADGTVTYVSTVWPGCGPFVCLDSFTYRVSDATSSTEATVFVEVTNTAPVANPDAAEIQGASIGTEVTVPVLANDFDAEGDLARSPIVKIPPTVDHGVASVEADGSVRFVYDGTLPGNAGLVQIPYTVTDESGAESNEAIIRIGVNVDSIKITRARYQENQSRWSVDGTCTDPSRTITVYFGTDSVSDNPVIASLIPCGADNLWSFQGQAANAGDIVVITDAPNYVSAESTGRGVDWGVLVDIIGANNPPTAVPDEYAGGFFNGRLLVGAPGVLGNDTDVELDPLTATLATGAGFGTVSLDLDGSFTYQPNAATYTGSDSFSYVANDGSDDSLPTAVAISGPVPLADAYSAQTGFDLVVDSPGVLENDLGVPVQGYSVSVVTGPTLGVLGDGLGQDGSFTYTPPGTAGLDSFTYEVCVGTVCSSASVAISITAPGDNRPPVAVDDAYDVDQNTPLVLAVLGNDTDPDPDTLAVSVVNETPVAVEDVIVLASGGTLLVNANGTLVYTPLFNFTGIDSFTYRANDGTVDSNVATVTVNVTDTVTVDSATYRIRRDRWQIQGSVSDVDSAVTVFMCTDEDCLNRELIGSANVNAIDGSWNFNGTGATRPPNDGNGPAWVVAVSSTGSESGVQVANPPRIEYTSVTIRN